MFSYRKNRLNIERRDIRMNRKKKFGNSDEREKARKLTETEQRRLERFESVADDMIRKGYSRVELTVSIVKANIFAVVLLIPLLVIGMGLFVLKNKDIGSGFSSLSFIWLMLAFVAMIFVHELLHGLGWSIFAENHFHDVEFGFMKQYLTPYCACMAPLSKKQYIFGALLPCFVLGIVPMFAGILTGSMPLLLMGILMTDSAAGDIIIVWNILRYRSEHSEVVYMDHPTQAGGVVFEK